MRGHLFRRLDFRDVSGEMSREATVRVPAVLGVCVLPLVSFLTPSSSFRKRKGLDPERTRSRLACPFAALTTAPGQLAQPWAPPQGAATAQPRGSHHGGRKAHVRGQLVPVTVVGDKRCDRSAVSGLAPPFPVQPELTNTCLSCLICTLWAIIVPDSLAWSRQ